MSTSNTETIETDNEPKSTPSRAVDFITRRTKDGSLPLLAGITLFVRTVRKRENRGTAVVQSLAATALVGIGLRQRRSRRGISQTDDERDVHSNETGTYERRIESHHSDTNPRGTSDEVDVETKTDPDEGSIQFTEDQEDEIQAKSNLDKDSPEDPHLHDEADTTEIDLSDASMADEASEAVGPTSGQSQPTQIDNTEPEEISQEEDSQQSDMDSENDGESEESR